MLCCDGGRNGKDWIVVLMWLLLILIAFMFYVNVGYSAEVCFSDNDAKRLVVELEQKRVLEKEVKEQEGLIENLKKQVDLLKQENQLLREQMELLREQRDIYKVVADEKDKEIRREKAVGFFERVKLFLIGAGVGAFVTLVVLY